MSLEIKKDSKWWYARFRIGGKLQQFRLDAQIEGERPLSITEEGNGQFERSRGRAQRAHDELQEQILRKHNEAALARRVYEIKTDERLEAIMLRQLPIAWAKIRRTRRPCRAYLAQGQRRLEKFVGYVCEHYPKAQDLQQVTKKIMGAYLDHLEAERISAKSWNDQLKLLRSAFAHLLPSGSQNPFAGIPAKATERVPRRPFTEAEIQAILQVAESDSFIRPVIVTGICTAMRRGDCCLLKWSDVDLKEGFVTVKTAKTGETAEVPIFPPMAAELAKAQGDGKFCFPEQAAMYQSNPDGITWRVKKVIIEAFRRLDERDGKALPRLPPEETIRRARAYLESLGSGKKSDHMRTAYALYAEGLNINQVAEKTGLSKPLISLYLNEIEQAARCVIVRGKVRLPKRGTVTQARINGGRDASVRDFHSFRVTWVTLALSAGMPMELVRRVTGHRTVEVVLTHYFRPGRDEFRRAIQSAMPKMLVAASPNGDSAVKPDDLLAQALDQLGGIQGGVARGRLADAMRLIQRAKNVMGGGQDTVGTGLEASAGDGPAPDERSIPRE